ncbi:hypothetical protein Naga_100558g3 [Nannochloropsis gaditana]|uniref:AB hydrolase-1 domain-containing protein n=1 Tax=Nannochloropsis gaditana TaxID=72520 RepID=W7TG89_9STRA|nr:hypothetical protein Naga_100558g3 [Nannochloropsis gaditana]
MKQMIQRRDHLEAMKHACARLLLRLVPFAPPMTRREETLLLHAHPSPAPLQPYPPWAYRLRFNDGLIPVSLPGMPAPADLFLRVVGDEQKEKDQGLAPILLVPGGPGLAHDYTETLEALVYGDRRVVSFDPVGTGQSSRSLPPALADGPPGGAETAEWKQAWSALLQEQLREILRFLEIDSHHVWAQGAACLPALQHTAAFAPPSSAPSPSPSPSALARGVKSLTLADPFVFAPGARSLPSLYSDRGAAVPLCVTESVAGVKGGVKGGGEGGREDRVHYERQWEGLPELGKVGNRPIFLSYGSTGEGEGSLDEVAVGRLRSRVEEGGREGGVVVKKFGSRLPHVDEPEAYVDWLDELLQGTEKMRPA